MKSNKIDNSPNITVSDEVADQAGEVAVQADEVSDEVAGTVEKIEQNHKPSPEYMIKMLKTYNPDKLKIYEKICSNYNKNLFEFIEQETKQL
jgi:hypothetical protein